LVVVFFGDEQATATIIARTKHWLFSYSMHY
jgi:hypothetical protein